MRSPRSRLVGLLGAEIALVAGLHGLSRTRAFAVGWSEWTGGLDDAAFEDAVGSIVLLVALGLGYWLLLSTVGYLGASFSRRPAMVGRARWITLPSIRRLVNRAVALSVAASTLAGSVAPAAADVTGSHSAVRVTVEVHGRGQLGPPGVEDGDLQGVPTDVIVPPHLRPALPAVPLDGSVEHRVTVRRGDHLWSLSERHLQQVLGMPHPGEPAVARYWARVIDVNRAIIRSGDPDLIYPGEVITLPRLVPDS